MRELSLKEAKRMFPSKPNPEEHFVVITREHLTRLAEAAIETNNPPAHMACDWTNQAKRSS